MNVKKLVITAMFLALAAASSLFKPISLPLGGGITILSMLPVCMLSITYGTKWGLISSFMYSLIQIALDFSSVLSYGLTPMSLIGCFIFDYLIAYTIIGVAGMFRNKGNIGIVIGVVIGLFGRFCSHLVSGTIIFDIWLPEGWDNAFVYSVCYNGCYMLPEIIFTAIGAVYIFKLPQIKSLMREIRQA